MTPSGTASPLVAGVALLERAIGYTLGSLVLVRPADLTRRTPCDRWDLQALLEHMNDSLVALQEATTGRRVSLEPVPSREHPVAAVTALRQRACGLLGEWNRMQPADDADDADHTDHAGHVDHVAEADAPVSVGGLSVCSSVVAAAGALEVAVHGWDVAQASGHQRSIPAPLAAELLDLAALLVRPADRQGRFGPPVGVDADADPGDRLVAFLGRHPRWPSG